MSTNGLRALAVTVAVIIAVLTGVTTGFLSGERTCALGPPTGTATTPVTPTASAGLGNAEPGNTAPAGGGGDTAPNGEAAPAPPPQAQPSLNCQTAAFGIRPALTAFLGAAFVGAALLLLLLFASRGARPGATGAVARPVSAPPAGRPRPDRGEHTGEFPAYPPTRAPHAAEADRATLVKACIYVRDRVSSRALADRLGIALAEAGVDTVEPTGARFDPAKHEAGGAAPSPDPAKIGSIAAVEVPGYTDRTGRVLRAPVVTVYTADGPGRDSAKPGRHTSEPTRREQR